MDIGTLLAGLSAEEKAALVAGTAYLTVVRTLRNMM